MERRPFLKKVAVVMLLVAASLAVVSSLHLAGVLGARSSSYNGTAAGVAEAIIGAALVVGALAIWRDGSTGRRPAVAATVFAIGGFVLGISITARSGYIPDIAYHATVLPILVVILIVLAVSGRPQARDGDAALNQAPSEAARW
jgi:peptidoglycan/LPS O-acetylase OafA/YrhL